MDMALLMNHKLPGFTARYMHETSLMEHLGACQEQVTAYILQQVGNAITPMAQTSS